MTTIETYIYENCIRERNNYFQNYEDVMEENVKLKEEIKKLKLEIIDLHMTIDEQESEIIQLNNLIDFYSTDTIL